MFRNTIQFNRLFLRKSQNELIQFSQMNTINMKSQASFGFFNNLFISKEQKQINQLYQQLYQSDSLQKVNIMKEIIKIKEGSKKQQNYNKFYYDQLALAEYLMKSGKSSESQIIIKEIEQKIEESTKVSETAKMISSIEVFARKLLLNPSSDLIKVILEKKIEKQNDTTYSVPYAYLVLAQIHFQKQEYTKCEKYLKSASEEMNKILKQDIDIKQFSDELYINMLIQIQFLELYFELKNFDETNRYLELSFNSWKDLEDAHTQGIGYKINKLNPHYIRILEIQIMMAEFFQDFSTANDYYQTILNGYDEPNQTNSKPIIQYKLKQLNCLILQEEEYETKVLTKEIDSLIKKFHPDNNAYIAELKMQEIHFLQRKNKLSFINQKIDEASQFCLNNKILDLTYARILIFQIKHHPEKGSQKCIKMINDLDVLLKSIKDVPIYILIDYYYNSAEHFLAQKDSQNISQCFRSSLQLLQTPPPQEYSAVSTYCMWIGYLLELNLFEEAKQLRKEAQEYYQSIKFDKKSDDLSCQVLFFDIDEQINDFEKQNK